MAVGFAHATLATCALCHSPYFVNITSSTMNQPISTLNLPKNTIDKLENLGFLYCSEVGDNLESLNSKIRIPEWSSLTNAPEAKTALELLQEEKEFKDITTFIPELDLILVDQIGAGCITELTGLPGSGKTQVCLHLAVGVKGEAVFIHTNKNLNSERLREIAGKYSPQAEQIMDKILCIEATDPTEFLASVAFLETWLPKNNIKLLIIDSIAWPFRQQLFSEQTHLRYNIFQNLRVLANSHNFGIVITNDLTTSSTGGDIHYTSSFGDSFFHTINNRVLLSKESDLFTAKVVKGTQIVPQEPILYKF